MTDKIPMYGQITVKPFETVPKDFAWSDHQTLTMTVVGDYQEMWNKKLHPGMGINETGYVTGAANWFIRTVDIAREEANVGILKIGMVYCPEGLNKPYSSTIEVAMEEVQKALITHPLFKTDGEDEDKDKALAEIRGWERYRNISAGATKGYGKDMKFYYTEDDTTPKEVEKETAKQYCRAVSSGIETYNIYLPVITRTSLYLRLPGEVTYKADSNIVSGGEIECAEQIGRFCDPPIRVDGLKEGEYFKSKDSYSQAADGSWTRTEQWTYTNDLTHRWIYDELKI